MKKCDLSTLLTCIGAVGMICATVIAVKSTPKAAEAIHNDSRINHDGDAYAYTKKEAVKSAYKCYLPTVCIAASSLACILGGNLLSTRKSANIAGAYAITNKAYQEYKEKVKELYGKETHEKIIESIAAEQSKNVHLIAGNMGGYGSLDFSEEDDEPKKLFYDVFSKRYFESTINKVLKAEYHLNRNFILSGYVSADTYFEFLGLKPLKDCSELVWEIEDDIYWIDFDHHKTRLDDGAECYVIEMYLEPHVSNYI